MNKIYARFTESDAGYACDKKNVRDHGLELGKLYVMSDALVGRTYTDVWLEGIDSKFNSVHFDFEDENGNSVDIYHMPEFWSYDMRY